MHAHDRFLAEWFNRIRSRQITLPRFQRHVAWTHAEVSALLTTVLRGLPSGAALILEVGDREKFVSRTMVDAPETGEKVTEQLLDGQQRLTALWRSLHATYSDRTYLVGFENDANDQTTPLPVVEGQARWAKNNTRYPVWVDDAKQLWARQLIPIALLRPGDILPEILGWISAAAGNDVSQRDALLNRIINLREKVTGFNLPYLALPASTPPDVALDVFVKMNTSAVSLETYDIVVALVEGTTGESLHNRVDDLRGAVPRAEAYANVPSLVLDVVALRQDRIPSQAGYMRIDFGKMVAVWDSVISGIKGAIGFLEEEGIFDAQRLPSYTAVPVIAALWDCLPQQPDRLGNARILLRKFLWRAFLTRRYERSSTTNALQDYRSLRKVLLGEATESDVPIFNEEYYPLPGKDEIALAEWPKQKSILGRGVLALSLRTGAEDLADGGRATASSISSKDHPREYHHLFPASTLEDANVPDDQIFRAANCALITWRTNRTISNKDPIRYLKERSDNNALGDPELRKRLKTHLIPYGELAVGYDGMSDEDRRARVIVDYARFLSERSALLEHAAALVCGGKTFEVSDIFPGE